MQEKTHTTGRKTRTVEHQTATAILEGSAIHAARLITDLIRGNRKRISTQRYSAAVFTVEQCLGKARQKVEHSGGIMTYGELARSAEGLDKKPRPILADALEIAHDYQEQTPAAPAGPAPASESSKAGNHG